jgi:hypothetical protein
MQMCQELQCQSQSNHLITVRLLQSTNQVSQELEAQLHQETKIWEVAQACRIRYVYEVANVLRTNDATAYKNWMFSNSYPQVK